MTLFSRQSTLHYRVLESRFRTDGGFEYLCENYLWQHPRYVQVDHLHWLPEEGLTLISRVTPKS